MSDAPPFNPRQADQVRDFRRRHGIRATATVLAETYTKFPTTDLLTGRVIPNADPVLYIKHYMGEWLRASKLASDRLTPAELWSNLDARRDFFMRQLEVDRNYSVVNADYFRAADRFFKYVPITSPPLIASTIDKFRPARILDIDVRWGSAIVALALAKHQSARYDGLNSNTSAARGLEMMRAYLTNDSAFLARTNIIQASAEYYQPTPRGYDLVIADIRAMNSEHVLGQPTRTYPTPAAYIDSYIAPLFTKIRASIAPGGHVLLITNSGDPNASAIRAAAKSAGFTLGDGQVAGQFTTSVLS